MTDGGAAAGLPTVRCTRCGAPLPIVAAVPFCTCGGVPAVPELGDPGTRDEIIAGPHTLWRWWRALPLLPGMAPVTLGEGVVPLEPLVIPGLPAGTLALRDDLEPTGSWKDRGSALLASGLASAGFTDVVEDSSGNAGLSFARYAALAGLRLTVFVPSSASPLKKDLVREAGATLVEVDGPRDRATAAAWDAVRAGACYASHAAQPLHPAGAATGAFDIAFALGRMPGAVVLACGQGGYLSALAAGFRALVRAGHGQMPRLVGVQSTACAPLAHAFAAGRPTAETWSHAAPGLAEGVICPRPARDVEALADARDSGGAIVAVDDLPLERAIRLLWREGFRVEPTAALPVAYLASDEARRALAGVDGPVVAILTGHGVRQGRALFAGLG